MKRKRETHTERNCASDEYNKTPDTPDLFTVIKNALAFTGTIYLLNLSTRSSCLEERKINIIIILF